MSEIYSQNGSSNNVVPFLKPKATLLREQEEILHMKQLFVIDCAFQIPYYLISKKVGNIISLPDRSATYIASENTVNEIIISDWRLNHDEENPLNEILQGNISTLRECYRNNGKYIVPNSVIDIYVFVNTKFEDLIHYKI